MEFYLHQTTHSLTHHANPNYERSYNREGELEFDYVGEETDIPELAALTWEERERLTEKERTKIITRSYLRQKEEKEKVVRECREVLEKLED
jgi:hypothetical protein